MEKVRIGMVGLGRLGMKHAENIAVRTVGAELSAVCALEPDRVGHACKAWGVPNGYDGSYASAQKLIRDGYIGRPILFRGYSADPESAIDGAVRFAPTSGGQFIDIKAAQAAGHRS